ncbi:hypothetical protein RAHE111665_12780 [Rariglobus hedericola]
MLLFAVLLTLCGVWMRWRAHDYRMSAEEAMKDGKLTYEQVLSRLKMIKIVSRIITVAGMALLIASLMTPEFWNGR